MTVVRLEPGRIIFQYLLGVTRARCLGDHHRRCILTSIDTPEPQVTAHLGDVVFLLVLDRPKISNRIRCLRGSALLVCALNILAATIGDGHGASVYNPGRDEHGALDPAQLTAALVALEQAAHSGARHSTRAGRPLRQRATALTRVSGGSAYRRRTASFRHPLARRRTRATGSARRPTVGT